MKETGFEKLMKKMVDREYSEMADIPEDMLYEELFIDEDTTVDEDKDLDYYSNRIAKGYGLTNSKL